MSIRTALVGVTLVLGVAVSGYLAYRYLVIPHHQCDLCGRAVHTEHQSMVTLKDGTRIEACCPRCALHHGLQMPGNVSRLSVSDRITKNKIDAARAVYVEGSDEETCRPVSEATPREPGVEYDLKFDRCLPSLLAFKEASEARGFASSHGGRLLTYEQALESVKRR